MKLVSLAVIFSLGLAVDAACSNPRVRSEWHQLSSSQKSSFVSACAALAKRPVSGQTSDPSTMSWHDFVQTHSRNAFWAHGNAQFYPYHRAMMWQFEEAIISTGLWPSSTGVPYFDWSAMSQNWWTSDIFSDQYFGSATSTHADSCVTNGAFRRGVYNVAADLDNHRGVTSGDLTCLRRNAPPAALTDATTITSSLNANSYLQFTSQDPNHYYDETNYHADGHGVLGGGGTSDMSNPSVSPNDPVFWLHHGFVDKYWWRWQNICPFYKQDYGGVLSRADDPISDGTRTATSKLSLDSWPFTASQMLNTQGNTLCYTYSKSAGDLAAPSATCPSFTPEPEVAKSATTPTTSLNAAQNDASDLWIQKLLIGMVAPLPLKGFGSNPVVGTGTVKPTVPTGTVDSVNAGSEDVIIMGRDNSTSSDLVDNSTAASNTTTIVLAGSSNSSAVLNVTSLINSTLNSNLTDSVSASVNLTTNVSFENVTALPAPNTYNDTMNEDGTVTVSFTNANYTIEIPANHTIKYVFNSHVGTIGPDGKPHRFFVSMDIVPYEPNPEAPTDVEIGQDPCYLAYPPEPQEAWVTHMGMNYPRVISIHNSVKSKIDAYNAANCNGVISPSSMLNQNYTRRDGSLF
ncbi:hypothetical protein CcCBS67573_g06101 [Chytriomyces confervae]|uniref:Tyrosinase copper-binding domain-containing protein n=1 Tax=Chytriomyces confervae TaxID=246404 RepID=A0A507F5R3_9FUNG|nr:hypothetical protein CcCBS67573_g06101 [Chytriomyces confervae]